MTCKRYVRYRLRTDQISDARFGLLDGNSILEIEGAPYLHEAMRRPTGGKIPLEEANLLAPCIPTKIYAIAGNYPDHTWNKKPDEIEPRPFVKPPSAIIGPGEAIILPNDVGRVDAEAELVAVIGTRCRNVSIDRALDYLFGVTCGNDISARSWQKNDLSWWRAKGSDTFSPIGPEVVCGVDLKSLSIRCLINGREAQCCNSGDLIHDIAYLISYISRFSTLDPGDLIFTGTAGIPGEIRPGDTVSVEISSIGTLTNTVAGT